MTETRRRTPWLLGRIDGRGVRIIAIRADPPSGIDRLLARWTRLVEERDAERKTREK